MRVQLPNGKFAKKTSAVYRFVNRTGKSVEDYYEWARQCGQKASHSNKDRQIVKALSLESIEDLKTFADTPNGMAYDTQDEYVLKASKNPVYFAQLWLETESCDDDSKDSFINSNLYPTTLESFKRFGDENKLSDVSPSWLSKDGIPIDKQCIEMSLIYGTEITENDVIEYLTTYRKGKYKSPYFLKSEEIQERFNELFGFQLTESYAKRLLSIMEEEEETVDAPF